MEELKPQEQLKPRKSARTPGREKESTSGHKELTLTIPATWSRDSFSDEKLQKIKEFREGPAAEFIKEEDDLEIARWLIARKWDLAASTKMYVDSMKWRQKENVDTILEWAPKLIFFKFLSDYWPNSLVQNKNNIKFRTTDGYLVIYERLTAVSPHILQLVPLQELRYFHIYIQELTNYERKQILKDKADGLSAPVVFVQDLCDLTMSHLTKQNFNMMKSFTEIDSWNYPETVRKVFIINAPSAWSFGWKVSKNFLDPVTIEKVAVLDVEETRLLSQVIPSDLLPRDYGGELDVKIQGGGSKDEIRNVLPKMFKSDFTNSLSITLTLETGREVAYQFRCKGDMCAGVHYQVAKDGKKETIVEMKKEDPEGILVGGSFVTSKAGLYTILWNNPILWVKRKLIFYVFIDKVILNLNENNAEIVKK